MLHFVTKCLGKLCRGLNLVQLQMNNEEMKYLARTLYQSFFPYSFYVF